MLKKLGVFLVFLSLITNSVFASAEIVKMLSNSNGRLCGVEVEDGILARRQRAIPLEEISRYDYVRNLTIPSDNPSNRINGRYVRTDRPHEVKLEGANIVQGYSKYDITLEILKPDLISEILGKQDFNAQDIINETLILEYVDGKFLAGHKTAPGFRGPEVARLHFNNERYLRIERWNWDTKKGDTADKGTPTLVLVLCSERDCNRED